MADASVGFPRIATYQVLSLLHTGADSNLYLGRQSKRKKEVVIRVLHTPFPTDEAKKAFAGRVAQIKKSAHRNTVPVLDFGVLQQPEQTATGYLVMEYVKEENLQHAMPVGQQYAADKVNRMLKSLAEALQYAHTRNVFHGNLHPGNLFSGVNNEAQLSDFSLSVHEQSIIFDEASPAVPYMAPEQLRGTITSASDQYALAVMVYEWLCGQRPYSATHSATLQQQQEHMPLPEPSSLNATISPALADVLLMALAYRPEERFPTIQSFADNYLRALMNLPLKVEANAPVPVFAKTVTAVESISEPVPISPIAFSQTDATATPVLSRATFSSKGTQINILAMRSKEPADTENKTAAIENDSRDEGKDKAISARSLIEIVTDDLCQGGILSQRLPGYEERPAQIEMAALVARSLTESNHAVIEAGTGTGKSLAYLVPIVRSGKVAIVSTANKALQEQLYYKDIPFVQKHIKHFEAALVKGMGNYVCLDRMETERTGMQFYAKNRDFMRLIDITNDPDAGFTGDFETLGFQLPGDIRGKVCADSDQCAWSKCGYFADCYVREMRLQAERAQIIVVNHTLLLLDAAMDGYLLPDREVIVLDEAHHLEEEATRSFTVTVNTNQIITLLSQNLLKHHSTLSLQDDANKAMMHAWERLKLVADPGYKGRANLHSPFEEGLKLATVLGDLTDSLRKQRPKDLPEKESQLYDKLVKRAQNLTQNIRTVFSVDQPNRFVYYVERVNTGTRGGAQLEVSAAPLDVTSWLKERLFDKSSVISTSATLATLGPNPANPDDKGPNFAYFRRRIGLDPVENPEVIERILPLTFDYESNALLYLPRDLPAPVYGDGADDYALAIAREMHRLVKLSQGRAFLLFSSKRMLDRAFDLMAPHLDFPLLRQGDMPRIELTRKFREEEGAVLFGLKSFWEGVDIAGDALSLVVIDKLPFDPPDDPVHEARVAHMKAAGENWFGTYVLPQAVLRLKQGLGRLLRTRDDRGVMAILDSRLHTKGYGRLVLDALPPARRTSNIYEVRRFFNGEASDV